MFVPAYRYLIGFDRYGSSDLLCLKQLDLNQSQAAVIRKRARRKVAGTVAQKAAVCSVDEVRHNYIRRSRQKLERA